MSRTAQNFAVITTSTLMFLAGLVFAQQPQTEMAENVGDPHSKQEADARRYGFGIGVQYDRVLRETLDLGLLLGKDLKRDGPFGAIALDVGRGGNRFGIGYGLRHLDGFIFLRAAVLEARGGAGAGIESGQRFLGPDLRIGTMGLTLGAGYYWRNGGTSGKNRVGTLSIGVLF